MGAHKTLASVLGLVLLLFPACSDDGPSAPAADEIIGLWHATRMEYVGTGPSGSIDLVAAGATVDLDLAADARYELTVTWPAESPEVTTGGWSVSRDVMTFTVDGMPWSMQFDCRLADGVLHLDGADADRDLDGDGTPEAATLDMELVR